MSKKYVASVDLYVAYVTFGPIELSASLTGNNKRVLELWAKAWGLEHLNEGKCIDEHHPYGRNIEWEVRRCDTHAVVASGSYYPRSHRYVRYA